MIVSLTLLVVPAALAWATAHVLGLVAPSLKASGAHIVWAIVLAAGAVLASPVVLLAVLWAGRGR